MDIRCILTDETFSYPFEAEMTRLKQRLRERNQLRDFQGKMIKFFKSPFRYMVYLKVAVQVERDAQGQSTQVPVACSFETNTAQDKEMANLTENINRFSEQILFEVKDRLSPHNFQEVSFTVTQYEELRRFLAGFEREQWGKNPVFVRTEINSDPKAAQDLMVIRIKMITADLDSLTLKIAGADII